jgi:hypothetical protein
LVSEFPGFWVPGNLKTTENQLKPGNYFAVLLMQETCTNLFCTRSSLLDLEQVKKHQKCQKLKGNLEIHYIFENSKNCKIVILQAFHSTNKIELFHFFTFLLAKVKK